MNAAKSKKTAKNKPRKTSLYIDSQAESALEWLSKNLGMSSTHAISRGVTMLKQSLSGGTSGTATPVPSLPDRAGRAAA